MTENVKKEISVAKRVIEFGCDDIRQNSDVIDLLSEDFCSERDWQIFAENALVIMDGWNILQYSDEYPIVHYCCDEVKSCCLEGGFRLNAFVESITVSTALVGKKFSVGTGRMKEERTDSDTVVYYVDHNGIRHAVIQYDIYEFLLQKPKLVVSPEGMLVFFTDEQILVTADLNQYCWIDPSDTVVNTEVIKNVEVCDDFCKITVGCYDDIEYDIGLKFTVDIANHHIICPKIFGM